MKFIILHLIAFFSGFSLMGYEILGSRVLAPYFGSSVFVWGAIITVFMLGLSIGYFAGGVIADRNKSMLDILFVLLCAIVFIFPVSSFGKLICFYFSTTTLDLKYSALSASIVLFIIPSICFGIISPYLVKLSIMRDGRVGHRVGSIYCISTIGSILGTLFVSFYMIVWIGTTRGIQLLCIPLLFSVILSLIFFVAFGRPRKKDV